MLFRYVVCDAQCANSQGMIECEDEAEAERRLWRAGLIIVELRPQQETRLPALLQWATWESFVRPVTRQHIEVLWSELASTLQRHPADLGEAPAAAPQVDLPLALRLLAERAQPRLYRSLLGSLAESTERGEPLSDALESHTRCATAPELRLLRAGEQIGDLPAAMGQMALLSRLDRQALHPVKKALTHSLLALLVALGVGGLAAWLFLPAVGALVALGGGNWASGTMVQMAHWVQLWLGWLMLILGAILICLAVFGRTTQGRCFFSTWAWRVPLAGQAARAAEMATVCRWLGALLEFEVPWVDALNLLPQMPTNPTFQGALLQVRSDVLDGVSFDSAVRAQRWLPDSFSRLLYGQPRPLLATECLVDLMPTGEHSEDRVTSAISFTQSPLDAGRISLLENHYRSQADQSTARAVSALRWLTLIVVGSLTLWLVLGMAPAWRFLLNS